MLMKSKTHHIQPFESSASEGDFNYLSCIEPLLKALGWQGDARKIFEAVPHLTAKLDLVEFRNLMIHLNYTSRSTSTTLQDLSNELIPCLFVSNGGDVYVILENNDQEIIVTNCKTEEQEILPKNQPLFGTAYHFYLQEEEEEANVLDYRRTWFQNIMQRFKPYFRQFFILGLSANILSLILPLFVRSVYDFVIPTHSNITLIYFLLGVGLAFLVIQLIHIFKSKILSYLGARLDRIIGCEILKRLLSVPVSFVEGVSVANQIARYKQYDVIREVFTGPLAQLTLDGPFVLVYMVALAFIGGPLALIPLMMILVFTTIAIFLFPTIRERANKLSSLILGRRTFLIESISNLPTLKSLSAEKIWVRRFQDVGENIALAQRNADITTSITMNLSQMIMPIAVLAAIIWGATRVMDGLMTVGSLISTILLIWWALAPLQVAFITLSRLNQVMDSVRQLNNLLRLPTERPSTKTPKHRFNGLIQMQNVNFHYPNDTALALQDVSLEVRPGETLAIMGNNGSGKSTVAKLLLGLYSPQGGSVTFDGIDILQFDPVLLRQSIAYVPQKTQLFHGTIAQNLRLAVPEASEERLIEAAKLAGLLPDIMALPEGFETRLTEHMVNLFSSSFLQKISLARAFLRRSKILILDEPTMNLDQEGELILKESLTRMKREKTLILITHRPSLTHLADRVLMLQNGYMRVFGSREKVTQILAEDKAA